MPMHVPVSSSKKRSLRPRISLQCSRRIDEASPALPTPRLTTDEACGAVRACVTVALDSAADMSPVLSQKHLLARLEALPSYLRLRVLAVVDLALDECTLERMQWRLDRASECLPETETRWGQSSKIAKDSRAEIQRRRAEVARYTRETRTHLRSVPAHRHGDAS